MLKHGLYELDANNRRLEVFDGKARVEDDNNSVDLTGGRELSLTADFQRNPEVSSTPFF